MLLFSSGLIQAGRRPAGPLTPVLTTTQRGVYTIQTVGDTVHQAPPENTRIILRVAGGDKKLVKPKQVALIDKTGALINRYSAKIAKPATKKTPVCRCR